VANPYMVNFGEVMRGFSAEATVTITNVLNSAVTLTGVSISTPGNNPGDFSATSLCPSSLAAGASCQIDVYFNPASGGVLQAQSATLFVSFPGLIDTPLQVPLTGVIGIGRIGLAK
jgi:hypothetical protein